MGETFASAAFSANGSLLALGGTAPRIYSVGASSLALVRTFVGLAGPAASVALSPDGTMIAAGAHITSPGAGAGVAVWRVADGSLVWTRAPKRDVVQVGLSPDGTLLAIGSSTDKTVELARVVSGQSVGTYTGHSRAVQALTFSPDGATIASGEAPTTLAPEVHLWRVADQALVRNLGAWGGFGGLAFSPDGTQLLSGNGALLNVADGAIVRMIAPSSLTAGPVAFSPDGKTYFIDGRLKRASDGVELRNTIVRTLARGRLRTRQQPDLRRPRCLRSPGQPALLLAGRR